MSTIQDALVQFDFSDVMDAVRALLMHDVLSDRQVMSGILTQLIIELCGEDKMRGLPKDDDRRLLALSSIAWMALLDEDTDKLAAKICETARELNDKMRAGRVH